jgi:hypothetical protein
MKGREDRLAASKLTRHGAVGARPGLKECHSLRGAFGQKLLAKLKVGLGFSSEKDRAKCQNKKIQIKSFKIKALTTAGDILDKKFTKCFPSTTDTHHHSRA